MCAIGGWLQFSPADEAASVLAEMMAVMKHRGPDDSGAYFDAAAGLALGHNRLSIIDLTASGHQPMVNKTNGDVITFNGEIYNFIELRRQLENLGYRFRSRSDTEVLLFAFAEWGIDCLSRIRGMYAFAIWRPVEKALYLARDPLGIKPLYYSSTADRLIFCSEVKAFMALPGFVARADKAAIGQFLEFGYTFELDRTALTGISKLPPGHYLRFVSGASAEVIPFFQPELRPRIEQEVRYFEEKLHDTLAKVVSEHLVADVPIGLLLSGGIDSSIIAALAAKHGPLTTISMGFSDSDLDERRHARVVANFIGSQHKEFLLKPGQIEQELAESILCFDDLFADWGAVSTRLLYKECQKLGLKVVLVGEGSDEIFGGYDIFRRAESRVPTEAWLFGLYRQYIGRRYGTFYPAFRSVMRCLLAATGNDRFSAIRQFETRYQLPNNYISKVDRASMATSVEARVPFLDQRVVELAYQVPQNLLLSDKSEKQLLRRVARRYHLLPEETIVRRKFGGSIAGSWMDDQVAFRQFAREVILRKNGWTEALGLRRPMAEYFQRNRDGYPFPHAISIFRNLAWRLLLLELWSTAFRIAPQPS
jgi:asparagine synthase (glutamine-hydrolysing)